MSQKQTITAVAALLVLGLAAVATTSASAAKIDVEKTFGSGVAAETCKLCEDSFYKTMVPLSKFRPQLELLCQYYSSDAETENCLKIMGDSISHLENDTPLEICQSIGFCKVDGPNKLH